MDLKCGGTTFTDIYRAKQKIQASFKTFKKKKKKNPASWDCNAYLQIASSSCREFYTSESWWFACTPPQCGCPRVFPGRSPHWWARRHSTAIPHSQTSSPFSLNKDKEANPIERSGQYPQLIEQLPFTKHVKQSQHLKGWLRKWFVKLLHQQKICHPFHSCAEPGQPLRLGFQSRVDCSNSVPLLHLIVREDSHLQNGESSRPPSGTTDQNKERALRKGLFSVPHNWCKYFQFHLKHSTLYR